VQVSTDEHKHKHEHEHEHEHEHKHKHGLPIHVMHGGAQGTHRKWRHSGNKRSSRERAPTSDAAASILCYSSSHRTQETAAANRAEWVLPTACPTQLLHNLWQSMVQQLSSKAATTVKLTDS
jgi:hypothetical protein